MGKLRPEAQLMFGADVMGRINAVARLSETALRDLESDLRPIGERFREIILTTPTNFGVGPDDMTLTDRRAWLQNHILRPVDRLVTDIANRPMFAPYPEKHATALSKDDFNELTERLRRLRDFAIDLRDDFEGRINDRSKHNTELRHDMISAVTEAFERAGIKLARGHNVRGAGNTGILATVVAIACEEISGDSISVDNYLKQLVRIAGKRTRKPA